MINLAKLKEKFRFVWNQLDERGRRLVAAAEAKDIGRGGITLVHQACGLSRNVIARGITEIERKIASPPGHVRRAGGDRKPLTAHDPTLHDSLAAIIDSETINKPHCQYHHGKGAQSDLPTGSPKVPTRAQSN